MNVLGNVFVPSVHGPAGFPVEMTKRRVRLSLRAVAQWKPFFISLGEMTNYLITMLSLVGSTATCGWIESSADCIAGEPGYVQ